MRWLVFTVACVAALVALGLLAVDERNVVWDDGTPYCPFCRSTLNLYAVGCKQCDRTFDWSPGRQECSYCLTGEEVEFIRDAFVRLELEKDPLPGELAPYPRAYFLSLDEGRCAYCGGMGKVENGEEGKEDVECPVCRGDGRCIACGGDRAVSIGDERARWAELERKQIWEDAERRSELTGIPMPVKELDDGDVRALRGYQEVINLSDETGDNLVDKGLARVEKAFAALRSALLEHLAKEAAAQDGS